MQHPHVLEVAIFTVKEEFVSDMPHLRDGLREALKSFSGLIEFIGYQPLGSNLFADIARWQDYESAIAAAKAFESGDPRFLPYMNAIAKLEFMGHFASTQS